MGSARQIFRTALRAARASGSGSGAGDAAHGGAKPWNSGPAELTEVSDDFDGSGECGEPLRKAGPGRV
jgi:hypothetical protein